MLGEVAEQLHRPALERHLLPAAQKPGSILVNLEAIEHPSHVYA
jgi:hypothetical protein